ncbi:MAG: stage III sporulation protein AE [Clostridia bacterium]|nr:stage III sporulation protein AE [Clostridia bacterium]
MRKNNSIRSGNTYPFKHVQNNSFINKSCVVKIVILLCLVALSIILACAGNTVFAADDGRAELSENIKKLLEDLDLSDLQSYLDENGDNYLFNFGGTAREIIEYLISGNLGTDYGSYLNELFSVIFKDVISLMPAFATVTAVALLSAVVSAAEGTIIGKSTTKIVHMACYSVIILIVSSMLVGVINGCISCINGVRRQIEIITPILATLTVLTGGTSTAAIYQPSAIFLSGGAVEIVSSFIFPATIGVIVLNFMSKLNTQMSFSGVSNLLKSLMKWVIGITVTVFSIFITAQSSASSLFDGIIFKATKYVIGNSVPIVGNFLSSGFDMLQSAGLLIKSSVGVCGIILLLLEIIQPLILLISFSVILKIVGAIVQPIGENTLYALLSDLSKDIEYFIAGLLTVAFMYALVIMLIINSANSFI